MYYIKCQNETIKLTQNDVERSRFLKRYFGSNQKNTDTITLNDFSPFIVESIFLIDNWEVLGFDYILVYIIVGNFLEMHEVLLELSPIAGSKLDTLTEEEITFVYNDNRELISDKLWQKVILPHSKYVMEIDIFSQWLEEGLIKFAVNTVWLYVHWAIKYDHLQALKHLLKQVNPSFYNNFMIKEAAKTYNVNVVKLLLQDQRVDPTVNKCRPFRTACKTGCKEIVQLFLNDKRINPTLRNNYAIRKAAKYNNPDVVRLLLDDIRVNPAAVDQYALRQACIYGNFEVYELLIADPRVDVNFDNGKPFLLACTYNRVQIVKHMLTINVQINEKAIIRAAKYGFDQIIELLIKNSQINPGIRNNYPLRVAVRRNFEGSHLPIIEFLLNDPRVDPSAKNNYCIRKACKNGDYDTVQLLLNHPSVDPLAKNNKAMFNAQKNGDDDIVNLLFSYTGRKSFTL